MNIRELTCIGCPMGCQLRATLEDGVVTAVTGKHTINIEGQPTRTEWFVLALLLLVAPVAALAGDDVRLTVGLCEQRPMLFDETIRQNL